MTLEELFSVQRDEGKLRSLCIQLARHEDFNPFKNNPISDMPKGGGKESFLDWYTEEKERLEHEIENCKKKLAEDKRKVNAYINASPYPECEIIRLRVLNNMSWAEIGGIVGYSNRQASRKFWDYIKKDVRNVRDVNPKV